MVARVLTWLVGIACLGCLGAIGYLVLDARGLIPGSPGTSAFRIEHEVDTSAGAHRRKLFGQKDKLEARIASARQAGRDVTEAETALAAAVKAFEARNLEVVSARLEEARTLLDSPGRRPTPDSGSGVGGPGTPKPADDGRPLPEVEELRKRLHPLRNRILEIAEADPEADYLFGLLDDAYEALAIGNRRVASDLVERLEREARQY